MSSPKAVVARGDAIVLRFNNDYGRNPAPGTPFDVELYSIDDGWESYRQTYTRLGRYEYQPEQEIRWQVPDTLPLGIYVVGIPNGNRWDTAKKIKIVERPAQAEWLNVGNEYDSLGDIYGQYQKYHPGEVAKIHLEDHPNEFSEGKFYLSIAEKTPDNMYSAEQLLATRVSSVPYLKRNGQSVSYFWEIPSDMVFETGQTSQTFVPVVWGDNGSYSVGYSFEVTIEQINMRHAHLASTGWGGSWPFNFDQGWNERLVPQAPVVQAVTLSILRGATQVFTAGGFDPGENVRFTVHSDPVDVGTVTADGNGVATIRWNVPDGFELGKHTVIATGLKSGKEAVNTFVVRKVSTDFITTLTPSDPLNSTENVQVTKPATEPIASAVQEKPTDTAEVKAQHGGKSGSDEKKLAKTGAADLVALTALLGVAGGVLFVARRRQV